MKVLEKPPSSPEQLLAAKRAESVSELYKIAPELAAIGTQQEYLKYMESIFPDSKIREVVWHAGSKDIEKFKVKGDEGYKRSDPYTGHGIYLTASLFHAKKYLAGFGAGNPIRPLLNLIRKGSIYDDNKAVHAALVDMRNPVIGSREDEKKKYLPKSLDSVRDSDLETIRKDGKDGIIFDELGTKESLEYVVAFDPEKVHVLGSKGDMESFKRSKETSLEIKDEKAA